MQSEQQSQIIQEKRKTNDVLLTTAVTCAGTKPTVVIIKPVYGRDAYIRKRSESKY